MAFHWTLQWNNSITKPTTSTQARTRIARMGVGTLNQSTSQVPAYIYIYIAIFLFPKETGQILFLYFIKCDRWRISIYWISVSFFCYKFPLTSPTLFPIFSPFSSPKISGKGRASNFYGNNSNHLVLQTPNSKASRTRSSSWKFTFTRKTEQNAGSFFGPQNGGNFEHMKGCFHCVPIQLIVRTLTPPSWSLLCSTSAFMCSTSLFLSCSMLHQHNIRRWKNKILAQDLRSALLTIPELCFLPIFFSPYPCHISPSLPREKTGIKAPRAATFYDTRISPHPRASIVSALLNLSQKKRPRGHGESHYIAHKKKKWESKFFFSPQPGEASLSLPFQP